MPAEMLDLAGIGIGPFNLSLAALLGRAGELRTQFFERRERFAWHPGLMVDGATLQTAYLKDLVSAADPTHPCSFTAYLVDQGRFYSFLAADFPAVSRLEFSDYLGWAAERLDNLSFDAEVQAVRLDDGHLRLEFAERAPVRARHLAVGTGPVPCVPRWAESHRGPRVFHSLHYRAHREALAGCRVAVVGAGQSGAEVVLDLLGATRAPRSVTWISRRAGLEPLDGSPFTDHCFTPQYVGDFHALPPATRERLLAGQKLLGDGISESTLRALYQKLYLRHFLEAREPEVVVLPHREAVALSAHADTFGLLTRCHLDDSLERFEVDAVVLATGQRQALPACVAPLAEDIGVDPQAQPEVDPQFCLRWPLPSGGRLYAQNLGRASHGIAEPQLSLMAWRSAVIANDVLGAERFAMREAPGFYSPLGRQGADTLLRDAGHSRAR